MHVVVQLLEVPVTVVLARLERLAELLAAKVLPGHAQRRERPVRRTRNRVVRDIAILVTGRALQRRRTMIVWTAHHELIVTPSFIALARKVRAGMAVQAARVREDVEDRLEQGLRGNRPGRDGQQQPHGQHSSRDGPPGGVGELGVPCVGPALVNAILAATGESPRELPLRRLGYHLLEQHPAAGVDA